VTRLETWQNATESMISELRAALKEHDVEIFEVGGYRNILHTEESVRQENLNYLARCIEIADRIGCRMVGTITGSRNPEGNKWSDNYAVHPDNWTLETWKLTVSGLKQILKDTAGMKAVLGLEAQITTNLDGPVAHRNLMEDVGDPRCKVNLDPANMIHLANHFHTTELLNQCFDLLGENIYGCHAKDSYVVPHTQTVYVQEVCPGRGSVDYETYLARLSRLKWSRALLPEHFPSDQNPEAYAYIRKVAAKVGVKIYG
jgi:sugar phosphate isomerase/epimerase